MSLPAVSLGLTFCASRKGRTGEVGGCTRRVQTSWPCLGLSVEMPWLALVGPYLSSFAWLALEKSSGLVAPPFLRMKLLFLVCMGSHWLRAMTIENSLMNGCGLNHESAARAVGWSFESQNPRELGPINSKVTSREFNSVVNWLRTFLITLYSLF